MSLSKAWQNNTDAPGGEAGTEVHFLVGTVILGFLSIFKKSPAESPYEALNSVCLSRGQRDVRPPVQMRRQLRLSLGSPMGFQTCLRLVR